MYDACACTWLCVDVRGKREKKNKQVLSEGALVRLSCHRRRGGGGYEEALFSCAYPSFNLSLSLPLSRQAAAAAAALGMPAGAMAAMAGMMGMPGMPAAMPAG